MSKFIRTVIISFLCLLSMHSALAIQSTEIHADASIGNFFHNAQAAGVDDGYDGIFDYRVEIHTPLFKLADHRGSLVTRVEGFGFIDNNIKDFFDDPLIDLPELYLQDDFQIKGMDNKIVFGKFANRRFFDKNEIMNDPFDIGERPFFSSIANVNTLLASIQTARDPDQLNSIQATGSYGFYYSIKDNDGNGFWDRWGYKQSFTVAQLNNFGSNFYGISEVNKNWGDKRPGQFDIGLLYAQSDVFRITRPANVDGKPAYLLYTSLTQKLNSRTSAYAKYGMLANNNATGASFNENNVVTGFSYKLTEKDSLGTNLVYVDYGNGIHSFSHLNSWTHKFNQNFYSTLFATFRYNAPAATPSGEDNNWFIGLNLTGYL